MRWSVVYKGTKYRFYITGLDMTVLFENKQGRYCYERFRSPETGYRMNDEYLGLLNYLDVYK